MENKILFEGKIDGQPGHYKVEIIDDELKLSHYDALYTTPWMPVFSSHREIELLRKVIYLLLEKS